MLPTPINWLQRPSMPDFWQTFAPFGQFLQNFISEDNLEKYSRQTSIGETFTSTGEKKDLADDEYFDFFEKAMLKWAQSQFMDDWRAFSYFQTAVYSEMERWFQLNQPSLRVRYLTIADQSREKSVDMKDQFFSWLKDIGMGRQPNITFEGIGPGILTNHFSQAILAFLGIGGELFGVSSPESIIVAHNFKDGVYQFDADVYETVWQSFCIVLIKSYVSYVEDNLGFEGLGSLFG